MTDLETFIRDRQDAIRGRKETQREKVVGRVKEIDWEGAYLLGMVIISNAALVIAIGFAIYVAIRS
jgi:hypothetical protein